MPATDKTVRNLKTMHVVFLFSVLAFLAATVTMLLRDHDDEWRGYQQTALVIDALRLQADQSKAISEAVGAADSEPAAADYKKEIQRLKTARKQIQNDLESGNADYQEATKRVDDLALQFDLQGRDVRVERAQRDVARANYDLQIRDQVPEAEANVFYQKFLSAQAKVDALELRWEEIESALSDEQSKLAAITERRDAMQDQLKALTAEVVRIGDSLDVIAPAGRLKSAKRRLMEMPIADGFNSHMRLIQDWLPDLDIKLGMAKTARFDRCRTCHLGIERFGAGDVPTFPHGETESDAPSDWVAANAYPHPFSSHPRPDVYLTAASPHPLPEFGCTICHDGQGSATNFTNAQHGPNDPVQDHEWHEKHNHSYNHFWEYPMLPERLRGAACIKCHHDVVELGVNPKFGPTAPKAYRGWQLIEKYGCFGCHEINGFDGQDRIGPDLRLEPTAEEADKYASDPNLIPGKMRKVGPSLKRIADKTTEEWIAYWTEKPKRFRPSTKMPQFFGLSNLEDHLGAQLSKLEIRAVARFLISQSSEATDETKLLSPPAGYKPDAERGRKAFTEKGCLACHSHDADEFKGTSATFGPNLTKVGHKVRSGEAGFNWLYTWISDPERHHPRTKMPNLFLTEVRNAKDELVSVPAADIAQFLIGPGEYAVAPLELDVVRKTLHQHLVETGHLTEEEFDTSFWEKHEYPHEAEWPETLLTAAEAGDLKWDAILSRYLEATEFQALARNHLVADDLLTGAEFDEFWKTRKYPSRTDAKSAPVVWPEKQHLQEASAANDTEWAAILKSYLDAKATLELSRLYLPGKILTADQFETLWGINWKGERAARAQIKSLKEKLDALPKGDGKNETDEQKSVHRRLDDAQAKLDAILNGARKLPLTRKQIKGDEIELYSEGDAVPSPVEWNGMMMDFLGRRSVSRYGCYACHDINGFGEARPIGTALQDWGRKDPSRLAPEHIHEYLHHHGRRDGSSTQKYIEDSLDKASSDSFDSEEEREAAMRTSFFYDSLIHHGRPGFFFQKLRQPRSYDYKKVDTKRYNERLVMPMFPLEDDEIEAIATFVLGLVAEPPAARYIYSPDQQAKDRNAGEILLQKYNCVGCHVIDLPELEFAPTDGSYWEPTPLATKQHQRGLDNLLKWRPPVQAHFGKTKVVDMDPEDAEVLPKTLPVVRARGLISGKPEPDEDPIDHIYSIKTWDPIRTRGVLAARNRDRFAATEKAIKNAGASLSALSFGDQKDQLLGSLTGSRTDWLESVDSDGRSVANAAMSELALFFDTATEGGPLVVTKEGLTDIGNVFTELYLAGAKEELVRRFVKPDGFTLDEFDEVWKSKTYPPIDDDDEWQPESLLTAAEAGELNWSARLFRYLEAVEFKSRVRKQLVSKVGLTAEEFDEFWEDRVYRDKDAEPPESILLTSAEDDSEWAAVLRSYLVETETLPVPPATKAAETLVKDLSDSLLPGPMGDVLLPGTLLAFGPGFVELHPARGGKFAEWLVDYQLENGVVKIGDVDGAWQNSPPPLYREGEKVQTDWLYRFLKDPEQIRYTPLLRMPKFNMSDEEARILTNYFAAADGADYPYEKQPQQSGSYMVRKEAEFHAKHPDRSNENSYRDESLRMLTSTLCIQCHAVGNAQPAGKLNDPNVTRGPSLNRVHERLRPEWVSVWVFEPTWITSYTSMPPPFPKDKQSYGPLFDKDATDQTIGVRDALMNYPELIERKYKPLPLIPATPPQPAAN
jgi:cytochrome c2